MGILSWILMGLIAGVLGKFLMPGRDPSGWIITIVLGILGAVVGGFVGSQLGLGSVQGFDIRSLALAIGGTVAVLAIYRLVKR
ncbi:MAG: GlsB/YeaQ/YmgE family stress response membrane protein [Pirellulaceae bacterium]|nr:GlsB/YeaQ/YmgE family stress response membrane protein [Pirellulaceae bacterium]